MRPAGTDWVLAERCCPTSAEAEASASTERTDDESWHPLRREDHNVDSAPTRHRSIRHSVDRRPVRSSQRPLDTDDGGIVVDHFIGFAESDESLGELLFR